VHNAPIKAASPNYPVFFSGIIDWCNRDRYPALVAPDLVYLAGLQ
jgi:hypothetical protein